MSSVAMALASYNEKIDGTLVNPGNLNDWLKKHNGYANGDLIVWSATDPLGKVKFQGKSKTLSQSQLSTYVKNCQPVVANVRGGSHWVLITGSTSQSSVWKVNDPAYSSTTYPQSEMLDYAIYRIASKSKTIRRFRISPDHQETEAIFEDWESAMLEFAFENPQ